MALFRTFAVPSVAAVLAQTGEFTGRPQKRYDDTDLILSELLEHGYDLGSKSPRRPSYPDGYQIDDLGPEIES